LFAVRQVTSVDNATGVIKVSRKALLDPAVSVPDVIRPLASSAPTAPISISKRSHALAVARPSHCFFNLPLLRVSVAAIDASGNRIGTTVVEPEVLPTFPQSTGGLGLAITEPFPMSPPRSYNPDYFRFGAAVCRSQYCDHN
jgi:hypothetical protein